MEDQKEEVAQFLSHEFPQLIKKLPADAKPVWGLMTPQHMVEHLIVTYKMSIGRIKIPVISAVEDHPRLKAYLMKDSPMRRSVPSPTGKNEPQPLRSSSLEEAVDKVLKETNHFLNFVKEQPEFIADHPYGGPMRADEWLCFHRKHIKHHLIQFNLLADYE
ncbi:MAG: DUF1569 domain-containing protein [Roseivirga sp.]|nr:DUF1569 domain-containing protein [Roseivirga sp.]